MTMVVTPELPLTTEHLFDLRLLIPQILGFGGPAGGEQRLGRIGGGSFEGQRLRGSVLAGGSDLQTVRSDGSILIDARAALQTESGAILGLTYTGIRRGPADVLARLARGEAPDPASYYFRVAGRLMTEDKHLADLNDNLVIGVGERKPEGPLYSVYRVA
jgi:hypothetical protein